MQPIKIGINGFGRIGRLAMRAAWGWPDVEFVHINDPGADARTHAHLLTYDSVHGHWHHEARAEENRLLVEDRSIPVSNARAVDDVDWSGCDLVLECSGKMRKPELLQSYLDQGVKRVVVSAPVKGVPNIVMGVNDGRLDLDKDRIVTAASCTTNCLAPVVKVIHEGLGIHHGSMTTIHGLTNDQVVLDVAHKDLRRARACGSSMIPTTTNSAKAITEIFPELKDHLNGMAVRVPITNASLTDCVFEVQRQTTAEEVNQLLKAASEGPLAGILGFEERELVSIDFKSDPRSSIVDAPSTMVINGTQVKIYSWYDNEWGYSNRLMELARLVGKA
ncbi:ArsJ-associated glyceraldehyde-3-phosphate dehydrogenase [Mangrovitalea sediminis]|uniref:ArsJ-associated glyceraldehyde-3-phosphate dehydrogenase n=1 Tax=Mangrovitalea sediminis TaxID=1982043 RepID=UPI000BE4C6FC|nr:ArsJ-associated glyceraldehyde-3-phosphate dehydrogenase [Mangrovitalea sediminis]